MTYDFYSENDYVGTFGSAQDWEDLYNVLKERQDIPETIKFIRAGKTYKVPVIKTELKKLLAETAAPRKHRELAQQLLDTMEEANEILMVQQ